MNRIRVGFHCRGNCWHWRLSKTLYYSGAMAWWSFWRFYLVIDRRSKAILIIIALTLLLASSGCNRTNRVPGMYASLINKTAMYPLGTDRNTEKPGRIGFDLVGTWHVFNYTKEGDKFQPAERLEDTWQFDRLKNATVHEWQFKPEGRGTIILTDGKSDGKSHAQSLLWAGRAFVIREHSFGYLDLFDAETGERFNAVRTDGPQGNDAVFIKYSDELNQPPS